MSYYKIFNLEEEPFSTSPDPQFLYRSAAHQTVLKRLETSIRLKRGLNVILGDVGTGKTTMARALLQEFSNEPEYVFHMILDPEFNSEFQFLEKLIKMFKIIPNARTTHDYRDEIEKYLFQKGVEEKLVIVLLIDEAQKLSANFLEVLRMLLNYETNQHKLLQAVLFGQMELLSTVKRIRNFYDRIALKYIINPLDEDETFEMINFRLKTAGLKENVSLYAPEAIKEIYRYSQGYPRRIAILCHNALEEAVIRGKTIVDKDLICGLIGEEQVYAF